MQEAYFIFFCWSYWPVLARMDGGDTSHVDMVEELFQILKCTTVVVVLYISGIWR